jgi:hypothetical protein
MIKVLVATLALAFPTVVSAEDQGKANCTIIEGQPDIRMCYFEMEDSPACHKLDDYPLGPQQLADFYGARVASYNYVPQRGGFLLVIVRAMPDGKMGSIGLFHKGEPGAGPQPGAKACIVAIGTQMNEPA